MKESAPKSGRANKGKVKEPLLDLENSSSFNGGKKLPQNDDDTWYST